MSVSKILVDLMSRARPDTGLPQLLCEEVVETLPVSGASLSFMQDPSTPGLLAASGEAAARQRVLQFDLGEGPAVDAYTTGRLVQQADLAKDGPRQWPLYAPAAVAAGVAAVFAFPLQIGGIRLGVLDLCRDTPGPLDDDTLTHTLHFVDAAVAVLLHIEGGGHGIPAGEDTIDDWLGSSPEVHQATGMVSVQAAVGLAEALLLMKARAFSADRSLLDIARDVVSRVIRFD